MNREVFMDLCNSIGALVLKITKDEEPDYDIMEKVSETAEYLGRKNKWITPLISYAVAQFDYTLMQEVYMNFVAMGSAPHIGSCYSCRFAEYESRSLDGIDHDPIEIAARIKAMKETQPCSEPHFMSESSALCFSYTRSNERYHQGIEHIEEELNKVARVKCIFEKQLEKKHILKAHEAVDLTQSIGEKLQLTLMHGNLMSNPQSRVAQSGNLLACSLYHVLFCEDEFELIYD